MNTQEKIPLLDYLAAHAPTEKWSWYDPVMPPKPERKTWGVRKPEGGWYDYISTRPDGVDSWRNSNRLAGSQIECIQEEEIQSWDKEFERQTDIQWPYFYARHIIQQKSQPKEKL